MPPHTVLNSSFPVLLPEVAALHIPEDDFQIWLRQQLCRPSIEEPPKNETATIEDGGSATVSEGQPVSCTGLERSASAWAKADNSRIQKAPFIAGMEKHAAHSRTLDELAADNQALTKNADVTNISAKNSFVNLFYDLGDGTTSEQLKTLLQCAWDEDPLLTLKIIFNARSIHLGKSNRIATYRAFGWLAENHPLTLLANLKWLVRPIIEKKRRSTEEEKKKGGDGDFDMVDAEEADPAMAHDVKYGMSHGYWKDLLNLVVFAANDQLRFDGDPSSLLTQKRDESPEAKRKRNWDAQSAKVARHQKRQEQNERVQDKMKNDPFYRALHTTVARLLAEQLKADHALLNSGKQSEMKKVSLAAKWAPTFGEFHDKHTFILSSISEILFPDPAYYSPDATNRELYLRHVREAYRVQYASPLRKVLGIVERDITAETFENIMYERVPSLAMDRYSGLFFKKDVERFTAYLKKVSSGDAKISGATLLPSTLISKARKLRNQSTDISGKPNFAEVKAATEAKIIGNVIDGQWNTLVKRVRDAGTLESSIAVCDVSGSMSFPRFKDGSCPMDSAIGLSLLISEVTAPPFGGGFITFSAIPTYVSMAKAPEGLVQKVAYMEDAHWEMNTDFVAVFEDVILPMAVANKLKQEDMVKQIFVFSDMQFDSAGAPDRWTTSYDRIKKKYAEAGYEMPRLIFWDLAANSTSKPATMDDVDTALVSGYSQGMLKAFLESGAFEDEELVEIEGEDGVVEVKKVRKLITPLDLVKKTTDHKAYSMLEVID
ncbi:d-lactate dehydrogenase [Pyrenophora seminiperda CCB06]|uniref:D-lactate dehydrogenase n=1 Tax=Pyrenophora seminiperda CCB06 TaxID=1302712 RepID=A0A3M7MCS4_9PLEO|nr:d-lactate dehydrogenase [Pyrenophora seminiperda CCB06]